MDLFPADQHNSVDHSGLSLRNPSDGNFIPHRGALCRLEGDDDYSYFLEIRLEDGSTHELRFQRRDFDFAMQLYSIMDTESRGKISKATIKEFVTLRCPVFWKRDDDLTETHQQGISPTFEEVWAGVVSSSVNVSISPLGHLSDLELGVEGWMVFCRFIALAQYLEAKRRFSGRHLQQTMRHRNAPRGSEVVVVEVPPPAPPAPLSAMQLAQYERETSTCLPLPELDLDHSLLAAHDILRLRKDVIVCRGHVKVDLFGAAPSQVQGASYQSPVEFCVTYTQILEDGSMVDSVAVRRSMMDMKWLNETLKAHKTLGGTLCGRILPPFPGNMKSLKKKHDDSRLGGTGEAIATAATVGVGIIKDGIKSLWGSYSATSSSNESPTTRERGNTAGTKPSRTASPRIKGSGQNSPAGTARQLERYLNYLLDHPALSTSFPLNTILRASQSGLEAAKLSLEEHTRTAKAIKEQTPKLDDGMLASFWPLNGAGAAQPNLSWVRTAAQAAVALQLHGILETTGLPSASARLQHASLPVFDTSRDTGWDNDEGDLQMRNDSDESPLDTEDGFEVGVMQVQDELRSEEIDEDNTGYDLLPLPVPAPERRILTFSDTHPQKTNSKETTEARFLYGEGSPVQALSGELMEEGKPALLGDIAVDENIDKLRDVIGSLDNTLARCFASSGGIGRARAQTLALHLDIVRGLDFWEGLKGKFVSQRALLKGVSGIEHSRDVFEESDSALIDDVSWQAALANSAVSAAEDVRSTVRADKTASSARAAAAQAASAAQDACLKRKFSNLDDARAAQTRASIAQSHAIYAAVVEHEAKTVKRRATLALAHDVKCWNAHRKREVLQTALSLAKSQHEASRRAVDAWSCLRDGFIVPAVIPTTHVKKAPQARLATDLLAQDEVEATIFRSVEDEEATIVAVQHELLSPPIESKTLVATEQGSPLEPETILPLVLASPIPEEDEDASSRRDEMESSGIDAEQQPQIVLSTSQALASSSYSIPTNGSLGQSSKSSTHSHSFSTASVHSKQQSEGDEVEALTSSMQSLVDGLMNWGEQFDDEEDLALPSGMAASIVLEESGVVPPRGVI